MNVIEVMYHRVPAQLLHLVLVLDELGKRRVPFLSRTAVVVEMDHGG